MGIIGGATFASRDKELRVQLNQQMEIENHRKMFQYIQIELIESQVSNITLII